MKNIAISTTLCTLLGTSVASHAALSDLGGGMIHDNDLDVTGSLTPIMPILPITIPMAF